jgi:hypothetical protein
MEQAGSEVEMIYLQLDNMLYLGGGTTNCQPYYIGGSDGTPPLIQIL